MCLHRRIARTLLCDACPEGLIAVCIWEGGGGGWGGVMQDKRVVAVVAVCLVIVYNRNF